MNTDILAEHFPILTKMKKIEFEFYCDSKYSLAACIVNANLPYRPGIYFVYDYSNNETDKLLYVGMAGADKEGNINTHQIPKRLLAVCYPPSRYLKSEHKKNINRNEIWPQMMKQDKISAIRISCFFSDINEEFRVPTEQNPRVLERKILDYLKTKQISLSWSKKS